MKEIYGSDTETGRMETKVSALRVSFEGNKRSTCAEFDGGACSVYGEVSSTFCERCTDWVKP